MAYTAEQLNQLSIIAHSTENPILEAFNASKELFFANKSISDNYSELLKNISEKISKNELTSLKFSQEVENFLKTFIINRGTNEQREASRRLYLNADCTMEQKGIRLISLTSNKENVKELYLDLLIVYKIAEILELSNARNKFNNDWNRFYDTYVKNLNKNL